MQADAEHKFTVVGKYINKTQQHFPSCF